MTPTHTRRVEVPNRMPQTSYEDMFCQENRYWSASLQQGKHNNNNNNSTDTDQHCYNSFYCLNWRLVHTLTLTSCYKVLEKKKIYVTESCTWTHLRFNADFDDGPCDGQDITDDEKDVPAINELHAVWPADFTIQSFLKILHKLLETKKTF